MKELSDKEIIELLKDNLSKVNNMVMREKSPQMDNSHQIDTRLLSKIIIEMHQSITALESRQSKRSVDEWISVKDRLPDEAGECWVLINGFVTMGLYDNKYEYDNGWLDGYGASHWMAMKKPEPPVQSPEDK